MTVQHNSMPEQVDFTKLLYLQLDSRITQKKSVYDLNPKRAQKSNYFFKTLTDFHK